jgi:hypothetical protein
MTQDEQSRLFGLAEQFYESTSAFKLLDSCELPVCVPESLPSARLGGLQSEACKGQPFAVDIACE